MRFAGQVGVALCRRPLHHLTRPEARSFAMHSFGSNIRSFHVKRPSGGQ